jgi:short-subunit dehydrogenase
LIRLAGDLWGKLDILVNNAGIGAMGRFADSNPAILREIMEVNFFAPVELVRLALPLLQDGNQPLIVNMGSVLGHRAVPLKSEYCASKFALHGWSDAMRAELFAAGIAVTMISPSTTDSDFFSHAIRDTTEKDWKAAGASSVERVAAATIRAIARGSHDVVWTFGWEGAGVAGSFGPHIGGSCRPALGPMTCGKAWGPKTLDFRANLRSLLAWKAI